MTARTPMVRLAIASLAPLAAVTAQQVTTAEQTTAAQHATTELQATTRQNAAARRLATDTTRYVVLNHGRLAGDLTVARTGDSLMVRYVYTDRNRGTRIESRYRLGAGGALVAGESRPVRADGTAGEPTERFDITGDSARFTSLAGGARFAAGSCSLPRSPSCSRWRSSPRCPRDTTSDRASTPD